MSTIKEEAITPEEFNKPLTKLEMELAKRGQEILKVAAEMGLRPHEVLRVLAFMMDYIIDWASKGEFSVSIGFTQRSKPGIGE